MKILKTNDQVCLSPAPVFVPKHLGTPLAVYLTLVTFISLIAIDKNLTLAPRPRRRSFIAAILISLPIRQHGADPRTVRQLVNLLKVLLADLKRLSRNIGNVLPY